jgi:hypothetical protein
MIQNLFSDLCAAIEAGNIEDDVVQWIIDAVIHVAHNSRVTVHKHHGERVGASCNGDRLRAG